jgi:ABC-type polysaccharide/polyol phosphate transport system ATPase subunit
MQSTSGSEWIVRARELRLTFDVSLRPPTTWREVWTEWLWRNRRKTGNRTLIRALDNLSFEIRRGDRIGILGKNGSGKSTLCRCVAGIYKPHHGKIEVNGATRSIFGMFPMIEPELTGRENARMLSRLFFGAHPRRRDLLEEALEFSELGKFIEMPVKYYSAGMIARLGLSIVSAVPSNLLLLDEVFNGADESFQAKISVRMKHLMENSGAVLFVSHSVSEIRSVCNRLWVYRAGNIVFDGPVEEGIAFYRSESSC